MPVNEIIEKGCDAEDIGIQFQKRGAGVNVKGWDDRPKEKRTCLMRAALEIKIPHEYDLDIEVGYGDIEIAGVAGDINASTKGGSISMTGCESGTSIEAKTVVGHVTVDLAGGQPWSLQEIELRSSGGNVELCVPKSLSAEVEIELRYSKVHEEPSVIKSDFELGEQETTDWKEIP